MRSDKPHRLGLSFDSDADDTDSLEYCRLSDVLPAEIVRQIGFDPDSLLSTGAVPMARRKTDPIFAIPHSSETPPRRATISISITTGPSPSYIGWFLVELSDVTVNASTTIPITGGGQNSVIVRDGCYLRLGRILRELNSVQTLVPGTPQIIAVDTNGELGDYVMVQTQIASALIPSFFAREKCEARFRGVETVSYHARALLRVKVSDVYAANIDRVIRLIIHMFAMPVEVHQ